MSTVTESVPVPQSNEEVNHVLAKTLRQKTGMAEEAVNRAALMIAESRAFLEGGSTTFREAWMDWLAETQEYVKQVRDWRMAINREQVEAVRGMNEVRQFLGGADWAESVAKLRELVELCERVEQVRKSGMLDAVVDTLLKVDARKS